MMTESKDEDLDLEKLHDVIDKNVLRDDWNNMRCLNLVNGVAGYLYVLLFLEKKVRRIRDNGQEARKEKRRNIKKLLHEEIA